MKAFVWDGVICGESGRARATAIEKSEELTTLFECGEVPGGIWLEVFPEEL